MKLAFALFKYFPYGGLQRNMMTIALASYARGHTVTVYTGQWQGDKPKGLRIIEVPIKGLTNHKRNAEFHQQLKTALTKDPADLVIGCNKMPGLDLYYAADTCFKAKGIEDRSWLYRLSSRYKINVDFEQAVFSEKSKTHILLVSEKEKPIFKKYYGTQEHRFHTLPPGISRDRIAPDNANQIRADFRKELGFSKDDLLILMVGSGFRTKGLDRSIKALASLPENLKKKTYLIIVGQDKTQAFIKLATKLGIASQVKFMGGRPDVPKFLISADILIHPAYRENTGNVLLEAAIAGLPVLTTDVCGYAHYVTDNQLGEVLPSPFLQPHLNNSLKNWLEDSSRRQACKTAGITFSKNADIYSRPEHAADVIDSLLEPLEKLKPLPKEKENLAI